MLRAFALATLLATAASAQTAEGSAARAQGQFVQALTALVLQDDSAAVKAADAVLERSPNDPTVLTLRADVARRLGATTDAVYYAERAAAAGGDARAFLVLAQSLQDAGRLVEASRALEDARSLAPDDLDVLVTSVGLAVEQQDSDAERSALLDLIRLGDTVAARLRLSRLAETAGDLEDARAQAQAAARLSPSEPAVARRLSDLTVPPTSRSAAAVTSAGGDIEDLLNQVDANPRQVDVWAQLLQTLAQASDARAGATADDALLLFGSVPSVLVGAAEAYASAGRTADALDASARALEALSLLGEALEDADTLRDRLEALSL